MPMYKYITSNFELAHLTSLCVVIHQALETAHVKEQNFKQVVREQIIGFQQSLEPVQQVCAQY